MKNLSAIIFTSLCLTLLVATPAFSAIQWTANGHYYEAINTALSWDDANDAASGSTCNGVSGHLATLTSPEEETWLIETHSNSGISLLGYLLGGTDTASEGTWEWVTGEDWIYENWRTASNEPNNSSSGGSEGEDYLQFHPNGNGWNDIGENNYSAVYGYIVEYDTPLVNTVPEPASMSLVGLGLISMVFSKKKKS